MHVTDRKLGEESAEKSAESVAEAGVEDAVTEPASESHGLQIKHEINVERTKAGLDPLLSEPQPPPTPTRDNFAIGGISLLVIVFLLLSNS